MTRCIGSSEKRVGETTVVPLLPLARIIIIPVQLSCVHNTRCAVFHPRFLSHFSTPTPVAFRCVQHATAWPHTPNIITNIAAVFIPYPCVNESMMVWLVYYGRQK